MLGFQCRHEIHTTCEKNTPSLLQVHTVCSIHTSEKSVHWVVLSLRKVYTRQSVPTAHLGTPLESGSCCHQRDSQQPQKVLCMVISTVHVNFVMGVQETILSIRRPYWLGFTLPYGSLHCVKERFPLIRMVFPVPQSVHIRYEGGINCQWGGLYCPPRNSPCPGSTLL